MSTKHHHHTSDLTALQVGKGHFASGGNTRKVQGEEMSLHLTIRHIPENKAAAVK